MQYEYCQNVEKILVKDGHVYGVRTSRGDEIHANYVASAPYPNTVYAKMIEPQSEVPEQARKYAAAMPMSVTNFSVVMLLDAKPEDLNIHSYSVFSSEVPFDTDVFWKEGRKHDGWSYVTTICLNYANPDCVPEGMTSLSITNLPLPEAFDDVTADNYFEMKRSIAKQMIDQVSRRLGVNLLDYVREIEIESPMTIARYTGMYQGGIYGYQHSMTNSVVGRLEDVEREQYIKGLVGCASHQLVGDGMACNINNGKIASTMILEQMKKEAAK